MTVNSLEKQRRLKLTFHRMREGLSQKEFAEKIGVAQSTVARIENGENEPSLDLAYKIAIHFDKTIEEMFYTELDIIWNDNLSKIDYH